MTIYMDERCPNAKGMGDIDWCRLYDKLCVVESGYVCEEWETIKEQWKQEEE